MPANFNNQDFSSTETCSIIDVLCQLHEGEFEIVIEFDRHPVFISFIFYLYLYLPRIASFSAYCTVINEGPAIEVLIARRYIHLVVFSSTLWFSFSGYVQIIQWMVLRTFRSVKKVVMDHVCNTEKGYNSWIFNNYHDSKQSSHFLPVHDECWWRNISQ